MQLASRSGQPPRSGVYLFVLRVSTAPIPLFPTVVSPPPAPAPVVPASFASAPATHKLASPTFFTHSLLVMFASLARLILVTALAVSALAAPDAILPTRSTAVARSNPVDIVVRQLANNSPVHLTNAQRLARGLPPKRPRSFHEGRAIRPRQSSNCVPVTGIISVTSDVDNANGYISRINNGFGEYTLTTDPSQALSVSFCQTESSSGFFNILALVRPLPRRNVSR